MNLYDTVIAIVALVGITILGALGKVDSAVLTTVYGAVVGGAVGHARGYSQAVRDESANRVP